MLFVPKLNILSNSDCPRGNKMRKKPVADFGVPRSATIDVLLRLRALDLVEARFPLFARLARYIDRNN